MPSVDQILYVEDKPYPEIHRFIEEHFDEIREVYRGRDFEFCSLATARPVITPPEVLNYLFPYRHFDAPVETTSFVTKDMLPFLTDGEIDGPMLIHYRPYSDHRRKPELAEGYCFTGMKLLPESETPLMEQFKWSADHTAHCPLGEESIMYSLSHDKEETADVRFEHDVQQLKEEVKERIQQLRRLGVNECQLMELVAFPPVLSPLVVTDEFKILLPDYENREIEMTPLVKAVYFLFLRHPEGIPFKNLPKYRKELLFIYKQITPRMQEDNIVRSVKDVTDPTKNSINEKCARIREAFLKEFDENFAEKYYVVGKRGEPKFIQLPRSMVQWPDILK